MMGCGFQLLQTHSNIEPLTAYAENSTMDDAVNIKLNTAYDDSLLSSDDANWYIFTIESDGCVSVSFSREMFESTTNYWKLTIYHLEDNLKEISTSAFDGNHTVSSTEDVGLPAGTYYIAVEHYPYEFSDRPYTLSVNFVASNNWEKEFNNTFQTATEMNLNENYNGALASSEDTDWFSFTLLTDGYVTLDFGVESFNDSTKYWKETVYCIHNDTLEEISSSAFDGKRSIFSTEDIGLPAGKYYIAVEHYPYEFSDRTYTLTVRFTNSDNWEKELNNTFQTASEMNLNESYNASLSSSNDTDWFSFTVPEDGFIAVDFERDVFDDSIKYWKSTIYRIDESMDEMASWEYDGNHIKSTSPEIGLPTGKYYIKIERYPYNYSSKTYTLTVNYKSSDCWEKEFNSTFQTATPVELNTNYQGSLYSSSDVDWYKFSTAVNGYATISFERDIFQDTTKYWEMTVYKLDESLEKIASWTYDGNHSKTFIPEIGLPSGNYYFKIERYPYNYSARTYTVNVNFKTSEYWEKEFNNTFQAATVINVNKTYNGSLYSSEDMDWYEFNLKQNSAVKLNFITQLIGDTTNHWKLHLYQRTDTIDELKSWNISGTSSVTAISDLQLDAGTYYLKVEDYDYYYNSKTYQLLVNDGTATKNLIGDATGDGEVDILDVITMNKAILGKEIISQEQLEAIDFNNNGKPDSDESLTLLKYIVGLIENL